MEGKKRNRPNLVVKSSDAGVGKLHTISVPDEAAGANPTRAVINQITKARESTRLHFKLLDNVTASGTKLREGTYLCGTVTDFGGQRVRTAVTSILVGGELTKVKLSVFDNDDVEGLCVPESTSRDFVKGTGASTMQQNINLESEDGHGLDISGEAIALQALQNIYNSTISTISSNIRKNKAKIRYDTVVYLINSDDARQAT